MTEGGPDPIAEPVDPNLEPAAVRAPQLPVVVAVALGGVLGAEARYGLGLAWPHGRSEFAWSTLFINGTGSLLLGSLIAVLELQPHPPLWARPFLGVGLLGGYTTFSTFAVDADQLWRAGRPGLAALYVVVTVVLGLLAGWSGGALTRRLARDRAGTAR